MPKFPAWTFRTTLGLALGLALSGCQVADFRDLDGSGSGRFAPRNPTYEPPPQPDENGLITFKTFQVAVARHGDTVDSVAERLGVDADELARTNGIRRGRLLRLGERLALPKSKPKGGIDIAAIATSAIDSAPEPQSPSGGKPQREPIRHVVQKGETAYTIARLYSVPVKSLAEWNALDAEFSIRTGQTLLVPIQENQNAALDTSAPGQGSVTPVPPIAGKPLPGEVTTAKLPPSPDLQQSQPPKSKFLMPIDGEIIKKYSPKRGGYKGIGIAGLAGTVVKAASGGEVTLVSKSSGGRAHVLISHDNNVYTVYSNITDVKVAKGDTVERGQPLAVVASGSPSFLHFEVLRGSSRVDPLSVL